MDELKESVSVKITCLEHMSQVLGESKRLNIEHREEAAKCKLERDTALAQLAVMQTKHVCNPFDDEDKLSREKDDEEGRVSLTSSEQMADEFPVRDENEEYFNKWFSEIK
jgi:hypothetical protein